MRETLCSRICFAWKQCNRIKFIKPKPETDISTPANNWSHNTPTHSQHNSTLKVQLHLVHNKIWSRSLVSHDNAVPYSKNLPKIPHSSKNVIPTSHPTPISNGYTASRHGRYHLLVSRTWYGVSIVSLHDLGTILSAKMYPSWILIVSPSYSHVTIRWGIMALVYFYSTHRLHTSQFKSQLYLSSCTLVLATQSRLSMVGGSSLLSRLRDGESPRDEWWCEWDDVCSRDRDLLRLSPSSASAVSSNRDIILARENYKTNSQEYKGVAEWLSLHMAHFPTSSLCLPCQTLDGCKLNDLMRHNFSTYPSSCLQLGQKLRDRWKF